jgi:DHA1 family bicyclomycin/chloramphenicol resistance-like MFS transporter
VTPNISPPTRSIGTPTLGLITGLLFAVGPITVDLSLPSLPAIQQAIGTPGTRIELTLTLLFFGLALTQLVFGVMADRFGRRRPLLLGLTLYCVASLVAAGATGITGIAIGRAAQALGYGVVIVLIWSAVADICNERSMARVYSIAITMMSIASVIAPALGGLVLAYCGWRAVFLTMAGYSLVALCLTAALLPETQSREHRSKLAPRAMLGTYRQLLRNARFIAFAVVAAGTVACQFSYNTGGPAMLIEHYGIPAATAGILLSAIALSTALAAQLNVFLLRSLAPERVMLGAIALLVTAAVALVVATLTGVGGPTGVVAILFLLLATPGLIVGNAMAAAISSAGDRAGAASALLGVLQFILGTVGSGIVGYLHDPSGAVLGAVILLLSIVTLAIALRARGTALPSPRLVR